MPRKKKEEELTNIDLIAKRFKKELDAIKEIVKLDGITLEVEVKPKSDMSVVFDKIRALCSDLKLNPISIEENKEKEKTFALQFPEYENKFSEEELEKLYISYFRFLLDSLMKNDHDHKVTALVIRKTRDIAIEQCISIYFRSYANQYKQKIEDLYQDQELKHRMQELYAKFAEEYIIEKELDKKEEEE